MNLAAHVDAVVGRSPTPNRGGGVVNGRNAVNGRNVLNGRNALNGRNGGVVGQVDNGCRGLEEAAHSLRSLWVQPRPPVRSSGDGSVGPMGGTIVGEISEEISFTPSGGVWPHVDVLACLRVLGALVAPRVHHDSSVEHPGRHVRGAKCDNITYYIIYTYSWQIFVYTCTEKKNSGKG